MVVDESDSDDEEGGFFSDEDDDDDDVEAEASLPGAERPAAPSAERASASIEASIRYEDTQVIDGGFFGCATGPHINGDHQIPQAFPSSRYSAYQPAARCVWTALVRTAVLYCNVIVAVRTNLHMDYLHGGVGI